MLRIDRKDLRAPARVLDLELTAADAAGEEFAVVKQYNTVWCLSRIDGVAQEISFWDVTSDETISIPALRDQLRRAGGERIVLKPSPPGTTNPEMTVVICTRDRPAGLHATLLGLQRQTDSTFQVVVVDNAPSSSESADLVKRLGLARCEYVVEPRAGLSRARNRGLKVVRTELVAWLDDDEIPDADWVRRLRQGFAHEANPAAVCGGMFPAELEFEAQVRFEQYGGFNKGRGMAPEVLRAGTPSVVSPLYPLPPSAQGGTWLSGPRHCVRWAASIPISGRVPGPTAARRSGRCPCCLRRPRCSPLAYRDHLAHAPARDGRTSEAVLRIQCGNYGVLREHDEVAADGSFRSPSTDPARAPGSPAWQRESAVRPPAGRFPRRPSEGLSPRPSRRRLYVHLRGYEGSTLASVRCHRRRLGQGGRSE